MGLRGPRSRNKRVSCKDVAQRPVDSLADADAGRDLDAGCAEAIFRDPQAGIG